MQKFLSSRYPLMCGAMSWVSERNLVAAVSNAGGFGVIACGSMSPKELAEEISETYKLTNEAFGVNLIVLHPMLKELAEVCINLKVPYVVLAGGLPSAEIILQLKSCGVKILSFAPSLSVAKRMIRSGVDALIIEGSEAGGHIGPVSTSVLAQEILPSLSKEVPIFVAGGIGSGSIIKSYMNMGAAGCQLGTRFVCAHESRAHPKFKQAFIRAAAKDAIVSVQLDQRLNIIPVRAIKNNGTRIFMEKQRELVKAIDENKISVTDAQMEVEYFWVGALKRAVLEGDIESGSIMAGQSVGLVTKEESVADIIHSLVNEASL